MTDRHRSSLVRRAELFLSWELGTQRPSRDPFFPVIPAFVASLCYVRLLVRIFVSTTRKVGLSLLRRLLVGYSKVERGDWHSAPISSLGSVIVDDVAK